LINQAIQVFSIIFFKSVTFMYSPQNQLKKLFNLFCVYALAMFALQTQAQAQTAPPPSPSGKRVAMVIGNENYQHLTKLQTPKADARLVQAALQRMNFEVEYVQDTSKLQLGEAMMRFVERANNADAAVFYFSGHGLEHKGAARLLPVEAQSSSDFALDNSTVDISSFAKTLKEARPRVGLILLDACRDVPVGKSTGAAKGMSRLMDGLPSAAHQVLVSYATQPGLTATDGVGGGVSPYANALALELVKADRYPILTLFDNVQSQVFASTGGNERAQKPEKSGDLRADTFLLPPLAGSAGANAAADQAIIQAERNRADKARRDAEQEKRNADAALDRARQAEARAQELQRIDQERSASAAQAAAVRERARQETERFNAEAAARRAENQRLQDLADAKAAEIRQRAQARADAQARTDAQAAADASAQAAQQQHPGCPAGYEPDWRSDGAALCNNPCPTRGEVPVGGNGNVVYCGRPESNNQANKQQPSWIAPSNRPQQYNPPTIPPQSGSYNYKPGDHNPCPYAGTFPTGYLNGSVVCGTKR
jgi:uncharacterized caspase-like protein